MVDAGRLAARAARLPGAGQAVHARGPRRPDGPDRRPRHQEAPRGRMTVALSPPTAGSALDPLATLREYHALAPWGLRDLAALAAGILDASGVVPVNAAARARPSEGTIRFYVARGLVSPPDGRGTAAVYSYRHLLQVLAIKLRQMEGATLEAMT